MADNGLKRLESWLNDIGLGQYLQLFIDNDIDMEILSRLSENDLEGLGLSLGHRKKMLRAIGALGRPSPAPSPPFSQAERRQLTVMFCDLVGSTKLSTELDPEDLRETIRLYQHCCNTVIERFDGFVAQYQGDGILVYFGYPRAHEDAAERAVRAGLAMIEAVSQLKTVASRLQIRIGLATGHVLVGEHVDRGGSEAMAVTGKTPTLAAKVQAFAPPDSIAIADSTRPLLGNLFILQDLGEVEMKGMDESVRIWRIEQERQAIDRFEALRTLQATDFVGRLNETERLLDLWRVTRNGRGCLVLIQGEAGIGKSRLVRRISSAVSQEGGYKVFLQCSAHHRNSPYHPFAVYFERRCKFASGDGPAEKLAKIEAFLNEPDDRQSLSLLARLLNLPMPGETRDESLPPEQFKLKAQALIARLVRRVSANRPILIVIEDMHWIDPSTEEGLLALTETIKSGPILVLATARPDYIVPWGSPDIERIVLERLDRGASETLIRNLTNHRDLPSELVETILARSDGVPLFIEEVTRSVLESNLLKLTDDGYVLIDKLSDIAIPSSLQDMLSARLDKLAQAKEVAQIGATLGRSFGYPLIEAVSGHSPARLRSELKTLVGADLVLQRGEPPAAEFVFTHALLQDAAYESMLRSQRRKLHGRVVETIERNFPDIRDNNPEILAHHCTQGELPAKSVAYWQSAGDRAAAQFALKEAARYYGRAEEEAARLPESPETLLLRARLILAMLTAGRFGLPPHFILDKALQTEALLERAGQDPRIPLMKAMTLYARGRALTYIEDYRKAQALLDQVAAFADAHGVAELAQKARVSRLINLNCMGEFRRSLDEVDDTLRARLLEAGHHAEWIASLGYIGLSRSYMSGTEQGIELCRQAVSLADRYQQPLYTALMLSCLGHALTVHRRHEEAVQIVLRSLSLSRKNGHAHLEFLSNSGLVQLRCRLGDLEGATTAKRAAKAFLDANPGGRFTYGAMFHVHAAELALRLRDFDQALEALERAQEVCSDADILSVGGLAHMKKARILLAIGGERTDEAIEEQERGMALLARSEAWVDAAHGQLLWGQALSARGLGEAALQAIGSARSLAESHQVDLTRCEYGAAALL